NPFFSDLYDAIGACRQKRINLDSPLWLRETPIEVHYESLGTCYEIYGYYLLARSIKKEIIEQFQKCHTDHPFGKFFGECTDLKLKLDKCFRQEVKFNIWLHSSSNCRTNIMMNSTRTFFLVQKAVKRKANFEESKKLKERLRAYRKGSSEMREEEISA
ncbi:hypothetical protein MIMGU_mgv1a021274mg, partial [Erythranthe guttata]